MNTLGWILVLVAHAAPPVAPRIQPNKGDVGKLELGPDVTAALKKFDPAFETFAANAFTPGVRELFKDESNETPMAIVGDFNGDKKPDVVVMGRSQKEQLVLAVTSDAKGYAVSVVDRSPYKSPETTYYPPHSTSDQDSDESEFEILRQRGLFTYLTLVPAVRKGEKPEPGVKVFRTDALTLESYRGESRLMHFEKGAFREWKPATPERGSAGDR